eukprot:scaffold95184_cov70-Cyclotella_meneghiniana.AAC.2
MWHASQTTTAIFVAMLAAMTSFRVLNMNTLKHTSKGALESARRKAFAANVIMRHTGSFFIRNNLHQRRAAFHTRMAEALGLLIEGCGQ